ncbi:hypothetical protein [Methylomonas methanica]|uniref:hypothetical protein n=1 Tax=Methylomonas methanica TaxID=421 RepID=UPI0012F65C9E|nr:hypothetical protein [Methylomonas methanica]
MKSNLLRVTIVLTVSLLVLLSSWPFRWILFNGRSAASFADHLLSGNSPKNEDSFIDYTIYTEGGCVVFSTHVEDRVMIYCPHGLPNSTENLGNLEHVLGAWYRQIT